MLRVLRPLSPDGESCVQCGVKETARPRYSLLVIYAQQDWRDGEDTCCYQADPTLHGVMKKSQCSLMGTSGMGARFIIEPQGRTIAFGHRRSRLTAGGIVWLFGSFGQWVGRQFEYGNAGLGTPEP